MIPMDDSGRSVVGCMWPIFSECCRYILYNQYKRAFFPARHSLSIKACLVFIFFRKTGFLLVFI